MGEYSVVYGEFVIVLLLFSVVMVVILIWGGVGKCLMLCYF